MARPLFVVNDFWQGLASVGAGVATSRGPNRFGPAAMAGDVAAQACNGPPIDGMDSGRDPMYQPLTYQKSV